MFSLTICISWSAHLDFNRGALDPAGNIEGLALVSVHCPGGKIHDVFCGSELEFQNAPGTVKLHIVEEGVSGGDLRMSHMHVSSVRSVPACIELYCSKGSRRKLPVFAEMGTRPTATEMLGRNCEFRNVWWSPSGHV